MSGGRAIFYAILFWALGVLVLFGAYAFREAQSRPVYGFTFSSMYAESLGLDAQETLAATLDAFHPAFVRFPLYWDAIERESDVFVWNDVDLAVAKMQSADVSIHMVIGAKVPRWPECFVPAWVNSRDRDVYRESLLAYIDKAVIRYAPVVDVWQVENELFFAFGDCPDPDIDLLKEEIDLVRTLDPDAEIQMTVSGEQQMWGSVAPFADRIGVSMYRKTSHSLFGSFTLPVPTGWYVLMRVPFLFSHDVVISELQMEPWFTSHPRYLSSKAASLLFTSQDALNNLAYARAAGFSEVSFWGVEWWYYLQQHGYPELWDTMSEVVK
ncbi:MAG: hypothetical protein AAB448_05030 [Patescibacteria group bacterium]